MKPAPRFWMWIKWYVRLPVIRIRIEWRPVPWLYGVAVRRIDRFHERRNGMRRVLVKDLP